MEESTMRVEHLLGLLSAGIGEDATKDLAVRAAVVSTSSGCEASGESSGPVCTTRRWWQQPMVAMVAARRRDAKVAVPQAFPRSCRATMMVARRWQHGGTVAGATQDIADTFGSFTTSSCQANGCPVAGHLRCARPARWYKPRDSMSLLCEACATSFRRPLGDVPGPSRAGRRECGLS